MLLVVILPAVGLHLNDYGAGIYLFLGHCEDYNVNIELIFFAARVGETELRGG